MARTLSDDLLAEIEAPSTAPVFIAELDTSPDPVRCWTGIGTLSFGGNSFLGIGHLGGISPVKETEEIRANELNFQLSGIPNELITTALSSTYHGRSAKLWLGFLTAAGQLLDAVLLFSGRMDVMDIDEGPEMSTITVTAESRLADLDRPRVRRYTHEDQAELFPGDLGLEYVAGIQNRELKWG
jgi:hypothetical protein